MKKYFRKFSYIILILILLIVNFSVPEREVEAKTLRDLKEELALAKKKLSDSQDKKEYTEDQIDKKNDRINSINVEIENMQEEAEELTAEIEELNNNIILKEKEIKQIMNYYELSSGDSAYLEYVFDAADYTDFIYRTAIAEQLSNYNKQLVKEYNQAIESNEQKKEDLAAKTIELNELQKQLEVDIVDLGSQLAEVTDVSVSAADEVKALEELVNTYENIYKCNLDDDLDECTTGTLPPGTQFLRPVVSGYISSDYGPRTYYLNGKKVSDFHYGVDFAGTGHGANVYSVANGKVAFIIRKASCGGNMVFIHHTVNGKDYTSGYFHLATINVKVNDIVTLDTIIGTVGGSPSKETWDTCSTGTHLHLQFATAHIKGGDGYYSRFLSKRINPYKVLNLPKLYGKFTSRTLKY